MMLKLTLTVPVSEGAYVVGGSIRDLILGRAPTDYDIAVLKNPEKFAQKIARQVNGSVVEIGKSDQKIIRVVSARHVFDIAAVNGPSIEADLSQRDFTINAMAYTLSDCELIDPLNGKNDLTHKTVRMISPDIFIKDPIRLIRAYRIAACLDFKIEPQTISTIRNHAELIQKSAGERIRTELFYLLQTSRSYRYLTEMIDSDLLFAIFPELIALRNCRQSSHHVYDVFEHTLKAYQTLENHLSDLPGLDSATKHELKAFINSDSLVLLKLAILLHDIGKPLRRTVSPDGNVHFWGHGTKSADMSLGISVRLKLSVRQKELLYFIIRNHLRPLSLFSAHQKHTLKRKALTRFYLKCGDNTPLLLLHALADGCAKAEGKKAAAFKVFVTKLLKDFFADFRPQKSKKPLITGADLIDTFAMSPSPVFKKILHAVEEARLSNEIETRQEALELVAALLRRHQ